MAKLMRNVKAKRRELVSNVVDKLYAIKETHSECFPERRVKFNAKKHKKSPWITNGILKSINNRNKLYKKLKQSRIDYVDYITKKTEFNKYRNTLSKTITNAKRVYYKQMFDRYKYDMKKTGVLYQKLYIGK